MPKPPATRAGAPSAQAGGTRASVMAGKNATWVVLLLSLSVFFNVVALVKLNLVVPSSLYSPSQSGAVASRLGMDPAEQEREQLSLPPLGAAAPLKGRPALRSEDEAGAGGTVQATAKAPPGPPTKLPPPSLEQTDTCDDERKVTQGSFEGNTFSFTGPCAGSHARWFENKAQACAVMDKFELYIVGQSTERRVYYGLQALAAGNPWAFKNGIPEEEVQHLKDQKGQLKNLERKPINCFHVTLRFETSFAGIAQAVKEFSRRSAKGRRRVAVVFQFGLYGLAANDFRINELAQQMDSFLSSGIASRARANGTILVWRPPVPVNADHRRFRKYNTANTVLDEWRRVSSEVARRNGACVLDTFDSLLDGVAKGVVDFETGEEWTPPQFGGIHLKDNGRKVVVHSLLNVLEFCANQSGL